MSKYHARYSNGDSNRRGARPKRAYLFRCKGLPHRTRVEIDEFGCKGQLKTVPDRKYFGPSIMTKKYTLCLPTVPIKYMSYNMHACMISLPDRSNVPSEPNS